MKKAQLIEQKQERQILNEKHIWRTLQHPFIVELADAFQNEFYLFMVLQFVSSGDLYYYIKKLKVR